MIVSLIPFPSELSMLIHFSKNYHRKALPKREKLSLLLNLILN